MKNKNIILIALVIILSILVLGLSGYIVYDKILNDNDKENNSINNNTIKEEIFDLNEARQIVDVYISNSSYLGGNIFTEGLTEDIKLLISLNNVSNKSYTIYDCKSLYGDKPNATLYEENCYTIKLDNNLEGACNLEANGINYEIVNNMYKSLFGNTVKIAKKDIRFADVIFDYNENNNSYISLSCNCGGDDLIERIYGVSDANIINEKLIIDVGYVEFEPYDETSNDKHYAKFDKSIVILNTDLNKENFGQEFIEQYHDQVDIYQFTFEKENNKYILNSMKKI